MFKGSFGYYLTSKMIIFDTFTFPVINFVRKSEKFNMKSNKQETTPPPKRYVIYK